MTILLLLTSFWFFLSACVLYVEGEKSDLKEGESLPLSTYIEAVQRAILAPFVWIMQQRKKP